MVTGTTELRVTNRREFEETRREDAAVKADREMREEQARGERMRALGEMTSGVLHDLNNCLSPILGFAELLLHQPDRMENAEDARLLVEMIHMAATDGTNIIGRLRELYRGRTIGEGAEPLGMNEIVDQCVSLSGPRLRQTFGSAETRISVRTDLQDVEKVLGNASELREAVMNLMNNSIDAMPEGGTLTLSTYASHGTVSVEVADTGEGMSPETVRRCREPFFSTKGEAGSGMGLAMIEGIVQRHEGELEMESIPGTGTWIALHFPAAPAELETQVAITTENNVPETGRTSVPLRGILAENDRLAQAAPSEVLRAHGG